MIASANRNCFPKPDVQVLCLQLLSLNLTVAAPCSFCSGSALDTLPKHSSSASGLSHQRQVWKIDDWPLRALHLYRCHSGQFYRTNCDSCMSLANGEFREKNWTAFCPSCKGQNAYRIYARKTDSILSFSYTKFHPKNLPLLEPELRNTTRSHSAVPRPLRQLECIFAPPPDICLRSMGRCTLLLCPSPGSLRDLQGLGQVEVEVKSTLDLSSRDVRFAQQKARLDLAYRRPTHLCDSTVAPCSPHSGPRFEGLPEESREARTD